jgi:hypothetical protein
MIRDQSPSICGNPLSGASVKRKTGHGLTLTLDTIRRHREGDFTVCLRERCA